MDLLTDPTAVTPEPAYPALTGTRGWFTGGLAGILVPTRVRYWFLNMIMNELCNLVTGAGLTLDPNNKTQVLQAVQALIAPGTSGLAAEIARAENAENTINGNVLTESNRAQAAEALAAKYTDFTQSFANNGWTRLPNGLILQWFEYSAQANTFKVAAPLPEPFATQCFFATATIGAFASPGPATGIVGASNISGDPAHVAVSSSYTAAAVGTNILAIGN